MNTEAGVKHFLFTGSYLSLFLWISSSELNRLLIKYVHQLHIQGKLVTKILVQAYSGLVVYG
jgi:hypothetical protein